MHLQSNYISPYPLTNGHFETIVPYFLRTIKPVHYIRERIETEDNDFLDLDWIKGGNKKLVILSHGLEGCSQSNYIQGLAKYLSERGYDALAWNNRGCSGEMNRLVRMYHSGASYDLREVLNHVFAKTEYPEIYLAGFSMGGNITLKYLGEESVKVNPRIQKAVAISTPISLADCAGSLSKGISLFYSKHFIRRIVKKLVQKKEMIEEFNPDIDKLNKLWDFYSFDNEITAPINGFENAEDYWEKSSSLPYLKSIKINSLIVNAQNDPFLAGRCYPLAETEHHEYLDLEIPATGGHVGFMEKGLKSFWTEKRIFEFFESR